MHVGENFSRTGGRRLFPAFTVWFTGLSGAGKSTLARALAGHLDEFLLAHELIDGDEIRKTLCSDLGFTKNDRDQNICRIGYVTHLLNRHSIIALVAAISPFIAAREEVRKRCEATFAC
jgi:adenylylsulfate kinase